MEKSKSIKCDVLIIGAGISGICSAINSSRLGLDVVILKKPHIECKDFIESISPVTVQKIIELNININFSKIIFGKYSSISNGKNIKLLTTKLNQKQYGYHVSKIGLIEELMLNLNANVRVISDVAKDIIIEGNRPKVVITNRKYNIEAKYFIDSSGSKRFFGKKIRLYEKKFSENLIAFRGKAYKLRKEIDKNCNAFFIPSNYGWTWIARLEGNSFYWTQLTTKKKFKKNVPTFFEKNRNNSIDSINNVTWRCFRPLCSEGVILSGEAAQQLDPATGQGIYYSLISGIESSILAYKCILNLEKEPFELLKFDNQKFNNFKIKIEQLSQYYNLLDNNIEISIL